jgi:hypothetical protein
MDDGESRVGSGRETELADGDEIGLGDPETEPGGAETGRLGDATRWR